MSSYTFNPNSLPVLTNSYLRTKEEIELDNFYPYTTTSIAGGDTYSIIRTNFTIDDEVSLRVRQDRQQRAQARLLITRVYDEIFRLQARIFNIDTDINEVDILEFRNITHRELMIVKAYLQENQT